jgi:hypothetical protein
MPSARHIYKTNCFSDESLKIWLILRLQTNPAVLEGPQGLTSTKLAWLRGAPHSATCVVILKLKLCCRSTLNGTTPKSERDGCTMMKSVPDFDGVHTIVSLTLIREVDVDNYTICSETMHRSGTCGVRFDNYYGSKLYNALQQKCRLKDSGRDNSGGSG